MISKISLILTSIDNSNKLNRFIDSINQLLLDNLILTIIFIDQGNNEFEFEKIRKDIKLIYIKKYKMSLSKARNIGLRYIEENNIIGFPDDDCWYPPDFFLDLLFYFADKSADCICTNVWDPLQKKTYGNRPLTVNKKIDYYNIFYFPISVGIFLRSSLLHNNFMYFNENFGVGTKFGSGEETDFLIRHYSNYFFYIGCLKVYHEIEKNISSKKVFNYSIGYTKIHILHLLNKDIYVSGRLLILISFIRYISTSLIGIIISKSLDKKKYYICRLKGILKGIL